MESAALQKKPEATFFVFYKEKDKFIEALLDVLDSKDIVPEIQQVSLFFINGNERTQKKLRFSVCTELWIANFAAYMGLAYSANKALYILTR
jgi:hypothetical protein